MQSKVARPAKDKVIVVERKIQTRDVGIDERRQGPVLTGYYQQRFGPIICCEVSNVDKSPSKMYQYLTFANYLCFHRLYL